LARQFRTARQAFEAARRRYLAPYPELFGNPFLDFQFRRIWAEMFRAARLAESFQSLLEAVRPSLVVFGYDGFVVERMLERVARREGVPTAALIHGGLTHAAGDRVRRGEADHLLAWGEEDVRGLARYGAAPDRVWRVGSLRYDELYHSAVRREGETRRPLRVQARGLLNLPPRQPTVLLLTASTMAMSAPLAHPAKHRETWRQVARLAARRPDLTFAIKPHPGWDHYEFYRILCRGGRRTSSCCGRRPSIAPSRPATSPSW
jgi:hypothetical protein